MLLIGVICSVIMLFFDLRKVIPPINVFTLVWYSVTNLAALRLRPAQRITSPLISWFGLAGCFAMFAWQPVWALTTGAAAPSVLAGLPWFLKDATGARRSLA